MSLIAILKIPDLRNYLISFLEIDDVLALRFIYKIKIEACFDLKLRYLYKVGFAPATYGYLFKKWKFKPWWREEESAPIRQILLTCSDLKLCQKAYLIHREDLKKEDLKVLCRIGDQSYLEKFYTTDELKVFYPYLSQYPNPYLISLLNKRQLLDLVRVALERDSPDLYLSLVNHNTIGYQSMELSHGFGWVVNIFIVLFHRYYKAPYPKIYLPYNRKIDPNNKVTITLKFLENFYNIQKLTIGYYMCIPKS